MNFHKVNQLWVTAVKFILSAAMSLTFLLLNSSL